MQVLVHTAAEAGLNRTEIGVVEVRTEEAVGRRLGISGVPYFVLNGTVSISGAQPPATFVSAFQQALAG